MKRSALLLLVSLALGACAEREAGKGQAKHEPLFASKPAQLAGLEQVVTALDPDDPVRRFYESRSLRPVFVDRDRFTKQAARLVAALARAQDDGLRPDDYAARELSERVAAKDARPTVADELLLLHTFMDFTVDLSAGRAEPSDVGVHWARPERSTELILAALNEDGVNAAVSAARPAWSQYAALREKLVRYRALEARGGWGVVDEGAVIEPGAEDDRVPALRTQLHATGDLAGNARADGKRYDAALTEAVIRFQRRHGLEDDGRVGGKTFDALQTSTADRIAQLELNLERWRWMPKHGDGRWILVNVPGFELATFEGQQRKLRMRVITGLPDWQTPMFTDEVESIRLHPTWTVPQKILTKELVPKLQEDPAFAQKVGLEVIDKETGEVVSAADVDWDETVVERVRLRQAPGGDNPLGSVRFEFPNRYAIYLHHTDAPKLFDLADRALSHGCVRVEDPIALAKFLLGGEETFDAFQAALDGKKPTRLQLAQSVPIVFGYFSAWAEADGTLQFRSDIYDLDRQLELALNPQTPKRKPSASSSAQAGR